MCRNRRCCGGDRTCINLQQGRRRGEGRKLLIECYCIHATTGSLDCAGVPAGGAVEIGIEQRRDDANQHPAFLNHLDAVAV